MKYVILPVLLLVVLAGCRTNKEYITNTYGPTDWQPPTVSWMTPPDAEVRGRVGIDVRAMDSSRVDSVTLLVDGLRLQALNAAPFRFEVITDTLEDGVHLLEARAWDQYGNLGISPILRINIVNHATLGPHVIWVPDSFATIQAAINAATDFDTIRVRNGTYIGALNPFGKGILLESEQGPMNCTINSGGSNSAIYVTANVHLIIVRGFTMIGPGYLINLREGSQANIYNNIVVSDSGDGTVFAEYCRSDMINNLFVGSLAGVELGYMWGHFYNNIVMNVTHVAFWNMSTLQNPLEYGYNLLWNNGSNYGYFDPGIGDILADPLIDLSNGRLSPNSPAIDAGKSDILDHNGTRSDIGPFGGPLGYH